jgi:hypothetical protein
MDNKFKTDIESVANAALQETADLHNQIKQFTKQNSKCAPDLELLTQWKAAVNRTNKAISHMARLAWAADDRRNIEMSILLENIKRDILDREATFAHTWTKLHQQTLNAGTGDRSGLSVERAQAAVFQIESALAALAPVPDTNYHGAPALALLQ